MKMNFVKTPPIILILSILAVYSCPINAQYSENHIADTLYYNCIKELHYDSIPYMVKDTAFLTSLEELNNMFKGSLPYSLKRAEFLVERAYSGGKMEYSKFCHNIDSIASILNHFIESKNIQRYKTAPNYALFEYFTKPNSMNGYNEFHYDFNDFTGKKDFRNLFITKVMETHTGQCVSLPLYYKILCDELGGQSSLAFAPKHLYVKHIGEKGEWINIELTNGHFVSDLWMIQTMDITTEAIRNGIFLTALSDKENIAFMITQLGKAYQQLYHSWDYFPLRCAESVLNELPNFCDALVLKYYIHKDLGHNYFYKYGNLPSKYSDNNYAEFKRMINRLDSLGYSQQTDEEYNKRVDEIIKKNRESRQ